MRKKFSYIHWNRYTLFVPICTSSFHFVCSYGNGNVVNNCVRNNFGISIKDIRDLEVYASLVIVCTRLYSLLFVLFVLLRGFKYWFLYSEYLVLYSISTGRVWMSAFMIGELILRFRQFPKHFAGITWQEIRDRKISFRTASANEEQDTWNAIQLNTFRSASDNFSYTAIRSVLL